MPSLWKSIKFMPSLAMGIPGAMVYPFLPCLETLPPGFGIDGHLCQYASRTRFWLLGVFMVASCVLTMVQMGSAKRGSASPGASTVREKESSEEKEERSKTPTARAPAPMTAAEQNDPSSGSAAAATGSPLPSSTTPAITQATFTALISPYYLPSPATRLLFLLLYLSGLYLQCLETYYVSTTLWRLISKIAAQWPAWMTTVVRYRPNMSTTSTVSALWTQLTYIFAYAVLVACALGLLAFCLIVMAGSICSLLEIGGLAIVEKGSAGGRDADVSLDQKDMVEKGEVGEGGEGEEKPG